MPIKTEVLITTIPNCVNLYSLAVTYTKDWLRPALGDASMSSIGSLWRCCPS